jgi:hypothetical protein
MMIFKDKSNPANDKMDNLVVSALYDFFNRIIFRKAEKVNEAYLFHKNEINRQD